MSNVQKIAAEWVARRHAGLSANEEEEYQRWLALDQQHAVAADELAMGWDLINRPRKNGHADWIRSGLIRRRQRRVRLVAATGLAVAAAMAVFFLLPGIHRIGPKAETTVALRPDVRILEDGSTVELNAGAEVAVNFTAQQRSVELIRGEALFEVAKNPARPFVVRTGGVEVRAVGTAFSVRAAPTLVDVLVTEGKVQVSHGLASPGVSSPLDGHALVAAGHLATVTHGGEEESVRVVAVSASEIQQALAWRVQRLEFTETPLAEAARLFNRQNRRQILIRNDALLQRRITGVFWSNDPDGFARSLELAMNLKTETSGNSIIIDAP